MNILIVKTDPLGKEDLVWVKKEIQKISLERIKSNKSVCTIKERSLESLKFNSINGIDFVFIVGDNIIKAKVIIESLILCATSGDIANLNDEQKTITKSRIIYFNKNEDMQPKNGTDISLFKLTILCLENASTYLIEFTDKSFLEKIKEVN